MGKIMKQGKIVLVLSGKHAGKKAVVVKTNDDGTSDKEYSHALVAGIARFPRKITRKMSKKDRKKRMKIKPFIKVYNYNHLMPTRYMADIQFDSKAVNKDAVKDPAKRSTARREIKSKFEERYAEGKNSWFFTKLPF